MSSVAHPALTGRHGVAHILTVNLPISSCALRANRAISCIRARTLLAFWGAKLPRGPFQYFAELCWEESKMSSVAPIPLTLEAPVALRVVDPRIGRALRFMEARLHTSLSVADMASEAGLSRLAARIAVTRPSGRSVARPGDRPQARLRFPGTGPSSPPSACPLGRVTGYPTSPPRADPA